MRPVRFAFCAVALTVSVAASSTAANAGRVQKTLHAFCSDQGCLDGKTPLGGLLLDPVSGTLYGTASQGGNAQDGSIFAMVPSGAELKLKFKQIYEFCPTKSCDTGKAPFTKLIADSAGDLYGTTPSGGTSNFAGTVFELVPNAKKTRWTAKLLYQFCPGNGASCPDGQLPATALTYQGQANGAPYDGISPLYGTTEVGGSQKGGVVFKLTPDGEGGWQESVLYNFCLQSFCADGALPLGDPIMDSSGNLFGTTTVGGPGQSGTVYELSGATRGRDVSETVLYGFCAHTPCVDGQQPDGGVTMDGQGNLYGTTQVGGARSEGVVYKVVPNGIASQFTVLYSFCSVGNFCRDGIKPNGDLALDSSGNLYGTTTSGGNKRTKGGTAFKLSPGSGGSYTLSTLYAFCSRRNCRDGFQVEGGVTLGGAGQLFGVTAGGGDVKNDGGVVYALTP